jgi:hypothetical protein
MTSAAGIPAQAGTGINGPAPISRLRIQGAANERDQEEAEQILVVTAARFAMLETTAISGVRGTVRCYSENPKGGFNVGARILAADIMVDFFAGRDTTPRFTAFVEQICAELRRVFADRITVVGIQRGNNGI